MHVDGFRFDLAPQLARTSTGIDMLSACMSAISADPVLRDVKLIAEPWDIGPGGYQLGNFPAQWSEWNDRFRDAARDFWRGQGGGVAEIARRIGGSADIYAADFRPPAASINFVTAHDGFTLRDLVTYDHKHNIANGEDNRDGHGENFSWNNGAEGETTDPQVLARRAALARAMLGTLFVSTGTIMLTAGDEFGRTQRGNNNAYAQDNAITWIDWQARDTALEDHVAALAAQRALCDMRQFPQTGQWTALDGAPMDAARWEDPATTGFSWNEPTRPTGLHVDRAGPGAGPEPGTG
jgi:glycogen operon protein